MSEQLIHFADHLVTLSPDGFPTSSGFAKPSGLWVSVEGNGDGWSDWCRDEGFRTESLVYEHQVKLTDSARVLRLSSAEEIDAFTEDWKLPQSSWSDLPSIDWPRLAQQYQGIIITPYIWARRLSTHTFWYYGWDCASGCIWDISAIHSFELAEVSA